jgi:proline racemase
MHWERSIELVRVHCQGEIGKLIVAGAPETPGRTMLDKMNHLNEVDDRLRRSRSIIGGEFLAEVVGVTTVGNRSAVSRITGQGWIYGTEELRIDPNDPLGEGFALSDTRGPQIDSLLKARD